MLERSAANGCQAPSKPTDPIPRQSRILQQDSTTPGLQIFGLHFPCKTIRARVPISSCQPRLFPPKVTQSLRVLRFDSASNPPYKEAVTRYALRALLKRTLVERQLAAGGWSFDPRSSQPDFEPTCLALLAVRFDSESARAGGNSNHRR